MLREIIAFIEVNIGCFGEKKVRCKLSVTPARTLSISGLKSRVLKLSFLSLKMTVKSGLEFILKLTEPLQRYLLSCQANSAILGRYFCTGQQQLWRGSVNFKINSRPLFTIIFKLKNDNFKTRDFSPLIKRVITGVNQWPPVDQHNAEAAALTNENSYQGNSRLRIVHFIFSSLGDEVM